METKQNLRKPKEYGIIRYFRAEKELQNQITHSEHDGNKETITNFSKKGLWKFINSQSKPSNI